MAIPKAMHPGMAIFTSPYGNRRELVGGEVVKMFDGSFHYIEYVNSSGAYAVPLASVTRVIKGQVANFTGGGRTISISAAVEIINPLSMGGNSQEYQRYVKIVSAAREGGMAKKTRPAVTFAAFEDAEWTDPTEGHTVGASFVNEPRKENDMAKAAAKAAKAGNKVAKVKAPKTVRNCACGCGSETTGYFAPGHDARLHGWISKLADGRIEPKDINASVRAKLGLVKTASGFKATKPHFYKD